MQNLLSSRMLTEEFYIFVQYISQSAWHLFDNVALVNVASPWNAALIVKCHNVAVKMLQPPLNVTKSTAVEFHNGNVKCRKIFLVCFQENSK